jgi:transcriptional regulator with XRE-family HTH domain
MRKTATKLKNQTDVQTEFGAAVRVLRNKHHLTQEELADRAEMHVTYVSQIERGLKNLSLFNIYRLARALDESPAKLFTVSGEGT